MDLLTESELIYLRHLLELREKELVSCKQLLKKVFGANCTECNCVEYEGLGYCRFGEMRVARSEDGKTSWPIYPELPKEGRREDCPYLVIEKAFPASRRDI